LPDAVDKSPVASHSGQQASRVRYGIIAMLFIVSATSNGDRVALSISGIPLARDLHLDAVHLGYLFSGFSWAYVAAQLPAGGLLDRYGCKRVYGISIVVWSTCAFLAGVAGYAAPALAFSIIFAARLISGVAQAPVFPGNGRIVAAWFPTVERGRASAIFNASQYFAIILFAPVMGWIIHVKGWQACFWFIGCIGLLLATLWSSTIYDVQKHPRIRTGEAEYIEAGGGLGYIGGQSTGGPAGPAFSWRILGKLLSNRLLIGVYLGQYCVNTLTWFFLTWFPVYLSTARQLSIVKVGIISAIPAACGFAGGILGGVFSDRLLRAGRSLTFARKAPIVVGMSLAMSMMLCNYVGTQTAIVLLMSLAFFGKGFGALGWTVISDTSPVGMVGLNGGVFNLIGNLSGITTPIIIGYLVKRTGSFHDVLIYVGVVSLFAILSYVPLAGTIRRLDVRDFAEAAAL
jgi:MFS transporter, ACS family, glucarate transporter